MNASNKNRRLFIKKLFAGSALLLINPSYLLGKNIFAKANTKETNFNLTEIKLLKNEAKEAFYKRNFQKAISLYNQLIEKSPSDITCYDGLKKVYGASQNLLEIVKLYKTAYDKNPEQIVFSDRYAKSLISLATGNEKQKKEYYEENNSNLFQSAIIIYIEAIKKSPEQKYLYFGLGDALAALEKTNKRLSKAKDEEIEISENIKNEAILLFRKFEQEWESSRQSSNKQKIEISNDFITFIKKISDKKRRPLFFEEEKQVREQNISKMKRIYGEAHIHSLIKRKDFYALPALVMFFLVHNDYSTNYIGLLKKNLKKNEHVFSLKLLYDSLYSRNKTFWTSIGRASCYKKCNLSPTQLLSLFSEVENKMPSYTGKSIAAIYEGKATALFKLEQYQEGETYLQKGLELLKHNGMGLSLMIKYAEGYALQSKLDEAINMLLYIAGRNPEFKKSNHPSLQYIHSLNDSTDDENISIKTPNSCEYLKVYYALSKLQLKQNDTSEVKNTINWIKELDPQNRFINKLLS